MIRDKVCISWVGPFVEETQLGIFDEKHLAGHRIRADTSLSSYCAWPTGSPCRAISPQQEAAAYPNYLDSAV